MRGISRRDTLLGDAWGIRRGLSRFGISLDVLETSEALGNVSGGVRRGAAYDGLTQVFFSLDTHGGHSARTAAHSTPALCRSTATI